MAGSDRWYFSKEVLANTPSRKCGIDADKELSYRQQAANLIQDMGQRLHVTQLCINTAIVYMHRFYAFHSFSKFHRNSISSCALFLAAKVEEQPRKLEHVIKVSHMCLHRETPPIDVKSEAYTEQAAELVFNENLMLQTLGFDIAVEHPHTSVVNCCQLVRASKDLAQTSYFMATNSLHLTTMCLQYKPTVVACVCIHLACKWSSWEIPRSTEGKDWFLYVDKSVSLELLEQLTSEFLAILDKCPSRLKRKIMASGGNTSGANVSLKPNDPKRNSSQERHSSKEETKTPMPSKSISQPPNESSQLTPTSPPVKKPKPEPTAQQSNKPTVAMTYADYRERKQRTQQESAKQPDQQSLKSNQTVKPVRDMSSQPKDRSLGANDKLAANAKQQQINVDKQRQMDERHKLKAKTSDYFANNRQTTPSKPMSSSQPKLQNSVTEDLFDNLNKPSDFNSIFTADDSLDFKTQITTDLKMEFSDNSNQSNDMLNLASFTSDFINDSSDSKKSLNISNNNNNNSKPQTNADTKQTSFMAIFSSPTPIASTNSSQLNSKPDNTLNIPSKFSSHDVQNMLSRIKPEPMLSPLKSAADIEALSKLEKQSLSAHSLSQPNLKNSLNQSYDSKPNLNSKTSKTPPKKREVPTNSSTSTKNFMPNSFQSNQSPKEDRKDISESSVNVKSENVTNQTAVDSRNAFITNNFNNNCLNIVNANESSHYLETIAPVVKQEIKEKPFAVDFPSVSSHSRPPMPPISATPDLDIKPNLDLTPDQTRQPVVSSPHQKPINNTTPAAVDQTPSTGKAVAVHNKDDKSKEKSSHDDKHHDKHHKHDKHSHHSHKSKKHKDSHKHKHKDKDKEREKHKRKDKDRDREREKERNRHSDAKDDQSFKVSFSPNKDKTDNSTANVAPLKLKIKKMSVDEPDKDNDVQPNPLKLKIQLNPKDRMTTNTPMTDIEANDSSAGRKRKSSPKSSKKEKIAKYDTESNNSHKSKDDKSSSKSSSKSKKSSNDANLSKKSSINNMFDERHSQVFTATGQPTANSLLAGQGLTGAHGAGPQRSSKAHK